jgi:hypothetical protein
MWLSFSLSLSEELESEALIEHCAVLILLSIVVESSIVSGDTNVCGLSKLEWGESVHKKECGELKTVLVGAEHILVIEEVGTKEEEKTLKVYNLRVFSSFDETRAWVCVCHYFY